MKSPEGMMKVAWATDVHLDMIPFPSVFFGELRASGADAIFLTGDIANALSLPGLAVDLADAVAKPVLFVLGNHDFYGGSIADVRRWAAAETRKGGLLKWMPEAGVVPLTDRVAVVGVDGWGDGRLGDPIGSDVFLSDWVAIRELDIRPADRRTRTERVLPLLRELGDREAETLGGPLLDALSVYPEVYVLTHVPPFAEATWHEGRRSDDDWMPWFSCEATGKVILEAARAHPGARVTVLCGHTHGDGRVEMLPNLLVLTGGARYGLPAVAATFELPGRPIG